MPHKIGIDARKLTDFGIGTYIEQLIRALAALETEHLFYLFVGERHRHHLDDLPDNFRVVVETSPVYSARELLMLSWRLFRLKLDLYHATHYVLPAVVPCRAVVTIHDIIHLLYPQFLPSPVALLYARRMIRRSLTKADRIITDSENTRSDLMEYFRVGGSNIEAIYPGVSARFRRRLSEAEIRAVIEPLGVTRPYLLFVGNPKPHKNLDRIVRAYARALSLGSFQGDLVCVGERGNRDFKIRERARQLEIEDRLKLLGHVDDEALPALYQGAELFLFPTLYEGFGLPVVEAMASGTAVITSSNSALKEIAEGHARLVDPLDVEKIAQAIAGLMGDPERRLELSRAGLERAEQFRWERTARQTLAVYEKALAN
ncbi:MAG: glycosyltransferase family 1 protein [Thermoanaerobaculia bacterium]|nr:glycosyltransferase family 1 protein [Thermoanaerobaculia bacterium]